MKKFVYCESTEGGMSTFEVYTEKELIHLYGWMKMNNALDDQCLLDWMEIAEIGEMMKHRLGCLFRVKD